MATRGSSRYGAERTRYAACLLAAPPCLCAGAASAVARAQSASWQPHVGAAIGYAHTRAGEVSFAVRTEQRQWGWRVTRTVPSASVLKAMLLVAYLDDPRVRDRALRASDRRLIDPMIQRSDNEAATSVLAFVGPSEVEAVARRAGMREFSLDDTVWGLSRIDAADQARFFLHIDREVVARHRAAAMHLLATVMPAQRWGIGRIRLPGWQVYFKGGWGAGTGEVEHQVVLLRHGAVRVSLAVLITDSPSHEYAKQTLQGLFARLLRGVGRLITSTRPPMPRDCADSCGSGRERGVAPALAPEQTDQLAHARAERPEQLANFAQPVAQLGIADLDRQHRVLQLGQRRVGAEIDCAVRSRNVFTPADGAPAPAGAKLCALSAWRSAKPE